MSNSLGANTEESEEETKTFDKFDKFNRKPFAEQLTIAVSSFWQFEESAYVLSLNAPFGSGKTTFLEMWQEQLKSENFAVININAWKCDFDEEPIMPIVAALLEFLEKNSSRGKNDKAKEEVIDRLKIGLATIMLLGNKYIEHKTGINLKELAEDAVSLSEDETNKIKEIGHELYTGYGFKQKAYWKLETALKAYANEEIEKQPLFIFVDELDRVRPNYAVEFLEAIKHIFSVKGVCFVLAVDRGQLEKSLKQIYGEIDFTNYYRRFITREVDLSIPSDPGNFHAFVNTLNHKYSGSQREKIPVDETAMIGRASRFNPRQLEHFVRTLVHFFAVEEFKKGWNFSIIFMVSLYVKDEKFYHKIGQQVYSSGVFQELKVYVRSLKEHIPDSDYIKILEMVAIFACDKEHPHAIEKFMKGRIMEAHPQFTKKEMEEAVAEYIETRNSMKFPLMKNKKGSLFSEIYQRFERWRSYIG